MPATITLFDPSVCTGNLGDAIIMDSVRKQIRKIFPDAFVFNVQTHDVIGENSYKAINRADYAIICGTNLLSSNMNKYNQWKINLLDSLRIRNVILMGVGWWQYQNRPNIYTKVLLGRVLDSVLIHSVRDNYTLNKLKMSGIDNVINTGCVTLWDLTPDHFRCIPEDKGDEVLMTFTDYKQCYELDRNLFEILSRNYKKIYFWIQGSGDYEYARKVIHSGNVEYIDPDLESLDQLLSQNKFLDYVGTRLHAGIRSLQFKHRTIILSVDNRAMENHADFSLPVIDRRNIECIENMIVNPLRLSDIDIPYQSIELWKHQFVPTA